MAKTIDEIVDRALSLIDEVPTTFATAATTETSIREQAIDILPDVARDLIKELPWELKRYLGETAVLVADTLITGENQDDYLKQKVVFIAPSDFWELVSLQLTVWSNPVVDYIYIGSEEYGRQNNPFTRSGKQNPIVALNMTSSGGNARIECFSVNNGDVKTVASFYYISFDNVPSNTNDWPDQLFDEITKALATQLLIIKSRIEEAQIKGSEITNQIEQHN